MADCASHDVARRMAKNTLAQYVVTFEPIISRLSSSCFVYTVEVLPKPRPFRLFRTAKLANVHTSRKNKYKQAPVPDF